MCCIEYEYFSASICMEQLFAGYEGSFQTSFDTIDECVFQSTLSLWPPTSERGTVQVQIGVRLQAPSKTIFRLDSVGQKPVRTSHHVAHGNQWSPFVVMKPAGGVLGAVESIPRPRVICLE